MSAILGKAGKRLFEQHLENYAPADPLYESYTDERGRQKRRKRELPPGLSARDAAILRSVKSRAHYLDKGFNLCGMRFGWTFFISLIPVVGDLADTLLNYTLIVRKARQADIPPWLLSRMMLNNAISLAVSFVPFVGDVVLAVYKANSRNAALLEEFLRIRGAEYLKLHPNEDLEIERVKNNRGFGAFFRSKPKTGAGSAQGEPTSRGGLTLKDAEQVKPGSGMKTGEQIEQVGEQDVVEVEEPSREGSAGGRSFTSLFVKSRKSSPTDTTNNQNLSPNSPGESRFVENVSGSSAAPSTS